MPSFDVVSELEMYEVSHAVTNTTKEIMTRFDFRGANVKVELNEKNKEIKLTGESDFQVEQVYDMLENHCMKRKVDPQCRPAKNHRFGQRYASNHQVKRWFRYDTAKKIAKIIKESGIKVQASIQGDKVRVTDKKKDTLQAAMNLLREQSLGIPLQFNNFKD